MHFQPIFRIGSRPCWPARRPLARIPASYPAGPGLARITKGHRLASEGPIEALSELAETLL